jgi:putative acetyltransferase
MLRRATVDDASAVHSLHMASIRGLASGSYSAAQIDAWCGNRSPQSYHTPLTEQFVLVAEAEGQLVGFAQLDASQSTVVAVYVHPRFVRQGIGLQLLRALESEAHLVGLSELRLQASLNAVGFYANAGYAPGAQAEHMVSSGGSVPCIAMSRTLR